MSTREKVFDDPLLAFMTPSSAAVMKTEPIISTARPVVTQDESIRTINTDKVTLKSKVSKTAPTAATPTIDSIFEPTSAVPNPSNTSVPGSKGLGFDVAVWDSRPVTSNIDVLATTSPTSSSSDAGLFSRPVATEGSRSTAEQAEAFRPKIHGRFKVTAEDNDEHFSDLLVSNLVEQEDTTADIALFGKTSVVQGAKGAVATQKAFAGARKDDFELESNDVIANLEKATVERKTKPATTVFNTRSFLDATEEPAQDIDLSTMDLNAYISQNSESQGGLFD